MIQTTNLHKITDVNITEKAIKYGVSELDIFKLIFALETEYRAYGGNIIEPHFTYRYRGGENSNPLSIAGIFEPDNWKAEVCICLFDELEEGKKGIAGREVLYPRKAKIATTFNLIKLAETPTPRL